MQSRRVYQLRHSAFYLQKLKDLHERYIVGENISDVVTQFQSDSEQIQTGMAYARQYMEKDESANSLYDQYIDYGKFLLNLGGITAYIDNFQKRYEVAEYFDEKTLLMFGLGKAHLRLGRFSAAKQCFEDNLEKAQAIQDFVTIQESLYYLALLALQQKEYTNVKQYQDKALDIDLYSRNRSLEKRMRHIFLSYSHLDMDMMIRVRDFLRKQSISVWADTNLEPGTAEWHRLIMEAIENSGGLVVILSPDAKNSQWVTREIMYAQGYKKDVFPILAKGDEAASIPIMLIDVQYGADIRDDTFFFTQMDRLVSVVKNCLKNYLLDDESSNT